MMLLKPYYFLNNCAKLRILLQPAKAVLETVLAVTQLAWSGKKPKSALYNWVLVVNIKCVFNSYNVVFDSGKTYVPNYVIPVNV